MFRVPLRTQQRNNFVEQLPPARPNNSNYRIQSARQLTKMNGLKLPRTLCFFLQALCDTKLTIELRGAIIVEGVLDSVDPRMK